ncbi:MAG: hypothetical protein LBH32_07710 [Dysgonamonadaceae bacterium]|nr:hypothetical protein [Dysgonamonadaceae bacterium]
MERDVLRQGDIINDVFFLGALNIECIQSIQTSNTKFQSWIYNDKLTCGQAIILSHSCEIDKSNGVKLTSLVMAPIRDLDSATKKEKRDELIASNIIKFPSSTSYLKYFYLEPNEKLAFSNGAIVDFSKCFSLKKQAYEFLLKNKVLQLRNDISDSMAFKLSLYYYRTAVAT